VARLLRLGGAAGGDVTFHQRGRTSEDGSRCGQSTRIRSNLSVIFRRVLASPVARPSTCFLLSSVSMPFRLKRSPPGTDVSHWNAAPLRRVARSCRHSFALAIADAAILCGFSVWCSWICFLSSSRAKLISRALSDCSPSTRGAHSSQLSNTESGSRWGSMPGSIPFVQAVL